MFTFSVRVRNDDGGGDLLIYNEQIIEMALAHMFGFGL